MAVDGRKLRKSLYQGSDEDHDFPCSPCTKEGKNVAAIKHCVECDENLCKKCLSDHNKFAVMRGHQLLDKVKSSSGKTLELPSQRCERHGKLIDVYCPGHDKVGCSTCMTIEHSGCQGMNFIPDIVNNTDTLEKIRLLKSHISTLQSRYDDLKQTRQKDWENTKKEKDQLLKEIRSERKKINDQLDKMEAELLQEVGVIFEKNLRHIESNLKEVDANIALLQENLDKVEAATHENASERYVQMYCANEKTKHASNSLETLERSLSKTETLRFEPYNHVIDLRCNTVGKIIHLQYVNVENCFDEFNIRIESDKSTCWVYEMCSCEDGSIAMADYNNKCIKMLNESFKVRDCLATKGTPCGICQVDPSMLAVTLINEKKVQFISLKEPMKLQQYFQVGDRCRGITSRNDLLYVCCGGSKNREDEGIGHLDVYTLSGVLLTSYFGVIECPLQVSLSRSDMEIFVVDSYKGIVMIDKKNRSMTHISLTNKEFSDPRNMCWLNGSQYCIAYYASGRFFVISCDGKHQVELLGEKNGTEKVTGMCFNSKTSKLVVSPFYSDMIRVYDLITGCC